jgi:hypothetical protein
VRLRLYSYAGLKGESYFIACKYSYDRISVKIMFIFPKEKATVRLKLNALIVHDRLIWLETYNFITSYNALKILSVKLISDNSVEKLIPLSLVTAAALALSLLLIRL